jgi:hypothetical protein
MKSKVSAKPGDLFMYWKKEPWPKTVVSAKPDDGKNEKYFCLGCGQYFEKKPIQHGLYFVNMYRKAQKTICDGEVVRYD